MARGAKLTPLIEFAVVGQIGLGHDAQHAAAVDDDRAVEETVFEAKRGSDQQDGRQLNAGLRDLSDSCQDAVQEGLLLEQVVNRIGGDAQFRKQGNGGAGVRRLCGQASRADCVEFRVCNPYMGHTDRHADKAMAID